MKNKKIFFSSIIGSLITLIVATPIFSTITSESDTVSFNFSSRKIETTDAYNWKFEMQPRELTIQEANDLIKTIPEETMLEYVAMAFYNTFSNAFSYILPPYFDATIYNFSYNNGNLSYKLVADFSYNDKNAGYDFRDTLEQYVIVVKDQVVQVLPTSAQNDFVENFDAYDRQMIWYKRPLSSTSYYDFSSVNHAVSYTTNKSWCKNENGPKYAAAIGNSDITIKTLEKVAFHYQLNYPTTQIYNCILPTHDLLINQEKSLYTSLLLFDLRCFNQFTIIEDEAWNNYISEPFMYISNSSNAVFNDKTTLTPIEIAAGQLTLEDPGTVANPKYNLSIRPYVQNEEIPDGKVSIYDANDNFLGTTDYYNLVFKEDQTWVKPPNDIRTRIDFTISLEKNQSSHLGTKVVENSDWYQLKFFVDLKDQEENQICSYDLCCWVYLEQSLIG